jgi:hypothetical protein
MWTAAKETTCGDKFEWCSIKLFFWLDENLAWKRQTNITSSDKCVSLHLDQDVSDGRLSRDKCTKKNRIVCEANTINLVTFCKNKIALLGLEIAKECQALHKVPESMLNI